MPEKEKSMHKSCQVLTFKLEEEIYGVDIMSVREVLDYTSVTKVPQTPEYMVGVINLRGNVVPVIDLKQKFGMKKTAKTVNTCIIIVEVDIDEESTVLGALADSVQEVVEFDGASIEEAPKIGTQLKTAFIDGMAKKEDGFVILLNVNSVFSTNELVNIATTTEMLQAKTPAHDPVEASV
ncbi:CheW protein [Denitrovibrio acetiphilus DSM 12809]|jgi:purine-binding chemotaxis protein CheW|uniref:Chemotaxis protein CheW n=1 Tax=Denitrovibrio acetiphilus (strain DSM 12809 / NBRC 114555 / N2460) TaxID=522772 RepID=D4H203_DENA2|nr:chemotaxis protein CheW [Denitrovibrio acetiphilus]ADD66980.1 CheW protein [Denitrovibrio acetiphilus DSM 12809]